MLKSQLWDVPKGLRSLRRNNVLVRTISIICFLWLTLSAQGQSWSIHANGNEWYPLGNNRLGNHPILWYFQEDGRGFEMGGYGIGLSKSVVRDEKTWWRYQLNVGRNRFYDEPTIFFDENGILLGAFTGTQVQWQGTLLGLHNWHIDPNQRFSIGTGVGLRILVRATSDYGTASIRGEETRLKVTQSSYRPFLPVLPIELKYKLGNKLALHLRGEWSILNVSRNPTFENTRSFNVFWELSYPISK